MKQFTKIRCYACGWISKELNDKQLEKLGLPWYCDECGHKINTFIKYSENERNDPRLLGWNK